MPQRRNNQPPTFWKYNLAHHMLEFHIENGQLPPFPQELRLITHISSDEGVRMGVTPEQTRAFWRKYNIPNSNALELMTGDEESLPLDSEDQSDQRKHAFSVISQTSTTASKCLHHPRWYKHSLAALIYNLITYTTVLIRGNPGVFQLYHYPTPWKPLPLWRVRVLEGWGKGFWKPMGLLHYQRYSSNLM